MSQSSYRTWSAMSQTDMAHITNIAHNRRIKRVIVTHTTRTIASYNHHISITGNHILVGGYNMFS